MFLGNLHCVTCPHAMSSIKSLSSILLTFTFSKVESTYRNKRYLDGLKCGYSKESHTFSICDESIPEWSNDSPKSFGSGSFGWTLR